MTQDPSISDSERKPEEFEFGEPAEVLVELARRGEIDPWDVDIARDHREVPEVYRLT